MRMNGEMVLVLKSMLVMVAVVAHPAVTMTASASQSQNSARVVILFNPFMIFFCQMI